MNQHWQGGLVLGLVGFCESQPVNLGHPFGSREEDLPLIFAFWNQHAVQSDVIDNNSVRQALDAERDQVLMAVALNLKPRRYALAGSNGDLQGFILHRADQEIRRLLVVRLEGDEKLRFGL